ncbi:MAG: YkgJ family cysteine cluster protein [Planctomycetota bacterium]|nr:YkgJ family cysteine cluster protein [Planctomycetota bacterium]
MQIEPAAQTEQLRREVAKGLVFCHQQGVFNTKKTVEAAAFSYALIELLIEKGVLNEHELNERKTVVAGRLVERLKDAGAGVMLQQPELDKYDFEGAPPIDCENRVEHCKAARCRLRFALSRQDLEERAVGWDLSRPYLIARGVDGYCVHFDREGRCCSIYDQRPVPCRGYHSRSDKRVWSDFDNCVVSPELEKLLAS